MLANARRVPRRPTSARRGRRGKPVRFRRRALLSSARVSRNLSHCGRPREGRARFAKSRKPEDLPVSDSTVRGPGPGRRTGTVFSARARGRRARFCAPGSGPNRSRPTRREGADRASFLPSRGPQASARNAFTLIELLVVIAHHRDPHRAAAARRPEGPRGRRPDQGPEQHAAAHARGDELRVRQRPLPHAYELQTADYLQAKYPFGYATSAPPSLRGRLGGPDPGHPQPVLRGEQHDQRVAEVRGVQSRPSRSCSSARPAATRTTGT